MYSELFETILRTSGENTDDVNSPEPDNFWAENRLFERVLREIDLTKDSLSQTLLDYFEKRLNTDSSKLSNDFIHKLCIAIVQGLLKLDKLFHNDQGFILIPSEGAKLRRGADHLQIRAFIDTVIQTCVNIANDMNNIPKNDLQLFQKTFIQSFSDNSANPSWKQEFNKYLTNQIAISKPFFIKIES